jgi:NAD(P)-dependent dehydrogenase (short-subunit alcohol dehydrogenase family)
MVKQNTPLLDSNAVLLVSGGAKGITAQCVTQIAEKAACRFILVGRSAILDPEPAWSQGHEDSADLQKSALKFYKDAGKKVTPKTLQKEIKSVLSSREIRTTLRDIQAAGGKAAYASADVTDEKGLAKAVKAAVEEMGTVSGVIHGAGNLADKLIENKSARDFELVVNTKIKGLKNILHAVQPENLRFLVLFSSVAGFFGNAGQADYAMANEILNKSAYILDKTLPDCRVLSINWGPWDSGMVSPELKKVFKERNIQLIPADLGAHALIEELTCAEQPAAQVLIGSPIHADLEFQPLQGEKFSVTRKLKLEDNAFLNDHRIGEQAVLPATCASAWLADTCASFHPGYTFAHMEDFKVLKGITFD